MLRDDELLGMVSDRDIRLGVGRARVAAADAEARGEAAPEMPGVSDLMVDVPPIEPNDPLSAAVAIMLAQHVSAVPVCVDGMFLGIVTRADVLEHYSGVG